MVSRMRPLRAKFFFRYHCLIFPCSIRCSKIAQFAFGIMLSLALLESAPAASASFSQSIRAIRAVGPEGAGNAAATAAWRELATGNVSIVVPLLEAMDGANDYALN